MERAFGEERREFNTEGPMVPAEHYCIPPLRRLNLPEIRHLLRRKRYFVLHAPRQTGKTSTLLALRDLLSEEGAYRCLYANLESAQASRGDVKLGVRTVIDALAWAARRDPRHAALAQFGAEAWGLMGPGGALQEMLALWAEADPKPLVLLLDEVDALVGDSLLSVLRQLRAGYAERPKSYPQSVVLCGVRDVQDYRIEAGAGAEPVTGGSPFNIKAESLRLGDFTQTDVRELLGQHTEETGQVFTEGAAAAVWNQTRGQPWLVNALAQQACFRNREGRDRSRPVGVEPVLEAREELILRRDTHIDQLAHKLGEDRVRRVIQPILMGEPDLSLDSEDVRYVRDLGLIAADPPIRIANPIYREVVPREITSAAQGQLWHETAWYVADDGALAWDRLLAAFQQFFRENSDRGLAANGYSEASGQLLLQAFLQRIVNSGGRVEREYALGRRRTDLLVLWPRDRFGGERVTDRTVIELKVLRGGLERTIEKGLVQTADYMDRCGASEGHLVIFDRDSGKTWDERLFRRAASCEGRPITVWGA